MNMLSFLSSQKSVFGLVFILVFSLSATDAKVSYSFDTNDSGVDSEVQTIEPVVDVAQDAARDEFWFPIMIWPVSNPVVSSGFGHRDSSCRLCSSDHRGVDFTPGRGSEIFAVMDGVVVDAGSMGTYGSAVLIEHPNGWQTLYAHMIPGSITVSAGDSVVQGKAIGLVGSSGVSTGAHLHFEIVIDGVQKNPMPILNELTKK